MHPYLMEQQIKARNENLHRELARPRPERRGTRPRPSLRHDLGWMLVGVMILATLLTLAERKWSAFMQDRVGPNRARISLLPNFLGGNSPLGGLPHVLADSLKMLKK